MVFYSYATIPSVPITLESLFEEHPAFEEMYVAAAPHLVAGRPFNLIHTLWGIVDAVILISLRECHSYQ